jgi:hypothetical protein
VATSFPKKHKTVTWSESGIESSRTSKETVFVRVGNFLKLLIPVERIKKNSRGNTNNAMSTNRFFVIFIISDKKKAVKNHLDYMLLPAHQGC